MVDKEPSQNDLLQQLGYGESKEPTIEEKMADLAEGLQVDRIPPEVDDELLEKIESIKQEAAQQKEARNKKLAEKERTRQGDAESARGLGVGLSVAYMIIGMPMLGLGIGYALDKSLNSTVWVPVGVILGSFLGVAMAIYIINRHQK